MEYILSAVFGQTLQRSGLSAAILVLGLFALVAIAVYAAKAKVDGWRQEGAAATAERAVREQERQRELVAREQERQALIGEIRASREQTFKLMENHLAHDKQEREELARVMSAFHEESRANVEILRGLQAAVEVTRSENSDGRGKLHERLNQLALQIAEGKKK